MRDLADDTVMVTCESCRGSGTELARDRFGTYDIDCSARCVDGWVRVPEDSLVEIPCPDCDEDDDCERCGGMGTVDVEAWEVAS